MKMRALSTGSAVLLSLAVGLSPVTPASALAADSTAGTWTVTASMSVARADVTATRLANGRILVVGGSDEVTTELYDPPTGAWLPGGS